MEPITNTIRLIQNQFQTVATWNIHGSRWESDFSMANPIFRGWDTPTNTTADVTHIEYCSLIQPDNTTPPCYSQILLPQPAVTAVTTGSTEYIYVILEKDAAGNAMGWSNVTIIGNGNATPNNTISCSILPAGTTGSVYIFVNPIMKLVGSPGSCASPATVVTDNGTYGANQGHTPTTDFIPFYSGDFAATGVGYIGFRQRDFFGSTSSAFTITAQISQPVDGVFSFDTTNRYDHLAKVLIGSLASGTASNTDLVGEVTASTGTAVRTFSGTYTNRPHCSIHDETTPANDATNHFVETNTTLTITSTGASDVISYGCTFRN